jgi:hypothetical protein
MTGNAKDCEDWVEMTTATTGNKVSPNLWCLISGNSNQYKGTYSSVPTLDPHQVKTHITSKQGSRQVHGLMISFHSPFYFQKPGPSSAALPVHNIGSPLIVVCLGNVLVLHEYHLGQDGPAQPGSMLDGILRKVVWRLEKRKGQWEREG